MDGVGLEISLQASIHIMQMLDGIRVAQDLQPQGPWKNGAFLRHARLPRGLVSLF